MLDSSNDLVAVTMFNTKTLTMMSMKKAEEAEKSGVEKDFTLLMKKEMREQMGL